MRARTLLAACALLLAACDNHRQGANSAATASAPPPSAPEPIRVSTQAPPPPPAEPTVVPPPVAAVPELKIPAAQIFEPKDLKPGERRPLLVFLHGLGASGRVAFDVLHLAALGARERIFVIAPDGDTDKQRRQFWNAGASCCNFDHSSVDDVARLTRLFETWSARGDVDPARLYLAGHSNGGFMSERLACALGDRLAAVASLSGAAPPAELECGPLSSLALLEVHGDADAIVHYAGGSVFDNPALAPHPSLPDGFKAWARRLGCGGAAKAGSALDLDPKLEGAETSVQEYERCARGSVALWTVHGGSHYVGTGTPAFEAVWRFLAAHHR